VADDLKDRYDIQHIHNCESKHLSSSRSSSHQHPTQRADITD
jgi:hypothetical protein